MERSYLTRKGYEKLFQELEYLKKVKRKEISQALAHARSMGDLRENAEYDAAKDALSQNERRVKDLTEKLSASEIIDDEKISSDKAYIGATIKLLDVDTNEEIDYTLVDSDEANALQGLISITSPVGKSLLGHKKNEIVEIDVPAGKLRYKILKISR